MTGIGMLLNENSKEPSSSVQITRMRIAAMLICSRFSGEGMTRLRKAGRPESSTHCHLLPMPWKDSSCFMQDTTMKRSLGFEKRSRLIRTFGLHITGLPEFIFARVARRSDCRVDENQRSWRD